MFMQINRNHFLSELGQKKIGKKIRILFLDIVFANIKTRFTQEKKSYSECCTLMHEFDIEHNENNINKLNQYRIEK